MGATARSYALGLALPEDIADAWVEAFAAGLARDQEAFGVALIGGDTVATKGPAVLSLTAFGTVAGDACLTRAGAGEGRRHLCLRNRRRRDAGLARRARRAREPHAGGTTQHLPSASALPVPRLALGAALVGLATCAIDVSDGLVADLGHLCEESGVAARINADAVPLSAAVRRAVDEGEAAIADLMTGGDDYELLFCAPLSKRGAIEAIGRRLVLAVSRIGTIEHGQAVTVVDADGRPLALGRAGYTHF